MPFDFNFISSQADRAANRWINNSMMQTEKPPVQFLAQKMFESSRGIWDFIGHRFYPSKDLLAGEEADHDLFSQILILSLASMQCSIFARSKNWPIESAIWQRAIENDDEYRNLNLQDIFKSNTRHPEWPVDEGRKCMNLAEAEIKRHMRHFHGRMEFLLSDAFENIFPQDEAHRDLQKQIENLWGQRMQETSLLYFSQDVVAKIEPV